MTSHALGEAVLALTMVGLALPLGAQPPEHLSYGAPLGAYPEPRCDGARSGRSSPSFPRAPRTLWQRTTGVRFEGDSLAVDESGNVFLAAVNVPQLLKVNAEGALQWRVSTQPGIGRSTPTLLNDGTVLVLTSAGEALGFAPSGALQFRTSIASNGSVGRADALPLREGGAWLSVGSEVAQIDASGRLCARARLSDVVMSPLLQADEAQGSSGPRASAVLAVLGNGDVVRLRSSQVTKVGSLGGHAGRGAAFDAGKLFAVVDRRALVALDVQRGTRTVLHAEQAPVLDGPPAVGAQGEVWLTSLVNELLVHDARDGKSSRVPLDASTAHDRGDSGAAPTGVPTLPLLLDDRSQAAFARADGRVGMVRADRSVVMSDGVTCGSPTSFAPAGTKRWILACGDGTLVMLGDEGRP